MKMSRTKLILKMFKKSVQKFKPTKIKAEIMIDVIFFIQHVNTKEIVQNATINDRVFVCN